VADLFEIESGVASLIEVRVPENGRIVGKPISGINIPDQCVVAAVIRNKIFVVPRGNTVMQANDFVVLVGPVDSVRAAHALFGEEKP